MLPIELTEAEQGFLVRLVEANLKGWRSRLDSAVSHAAIERRDRALRAIQANEALLSKLLSLHPSPSGPSEGNSPAPIGPEDA